MNAIACHAGRTARLDHAGTAPGSGSWPVLLLALLGASACGHLSQPASGSEGSFDSAYDSAGAAVGDLPVEGEPVGDVHGEPVADYEGEAWVESPVVGRPCHDCPTWTIQVDALMLWQGGIPSRPLYLDSATRATAIDANDLQTPVTIDPRYAIIYHADECRSLEVNYFNLWGFEGQAVAPPAARGYEMNDLAGLNFTGLDTAEATSQASIKSLEFNLRRRGWGEIEWLTGFRWMEWNQSLVMSDTFSTPTPGSDVIGVGTVNNLYGWQWGGDMMLWNRGDRLRVNGIAKAGVYYNHQAGQVTTYTTDRALPTVIGDADDTVAFVGETGIMASYSLTNWLAVRLGYTFFWLGGVATPADQLDETIVDPTLTPEAKVSPYGSVFLQGVQTGVEARW
jgi:hypothetical protein